MAKPSKTNIQPPTTPPKTNWDLDIQADREAAIAAGTYGDNDGTPNNGDAFDTLIHQINIPTTGPDLTVDDLQEYDYAFFGVNGGSDETVYGRDIMAGILVTGNGKDHVYGGQWDDVIFSGNGADVDHGGGGNDIIYSENGPDQLYGDADDGTATFEEPSEGQDIVLVDLIDKIDDGTLAPGDGHIIENGQHAGDYQDNSGSLQKVGVYEDGGDFYDLFSFDPPDLPVLNVLDSQHISVYLYDDGWTNPIHLGSWDLMENQQVYFGVDISTYPDGKHVVVFDGEPTQAMLDDPEQNWLKQQATDKLADIVDHEEGQTPPPTFVGGDQLIGGNGPDQFVWDANDVQSVDVIWDYNQGNGSYDPLEGDQLILKNTGLTDVNDLTTFNFDVDGDGDATNDLVIFIDTNQAIGLVGIDDISKVDVHFG